MLNSYTSEQWSQTDFGLLTMSNVPTRCILQYIKMKHEINRYIFVKNCNIKKFSTIWALWKIFLINVFPFFTRLLSTLISYNNMYVHVSMSLSDAKICKLNDLPRFYDFVNDFYPYERFAIFFQKHYENWSYQQLNRQHMSCIF